MRPLVLIAALLIASCGQAGTAEPSLTTSVVPTASQAASPVTSTKGAITLRLPSSNATLTSPVTISGDASVFEANLQWRITDSSGRVLAEDFTTASEGAPGRGDFSITATYTVSRETAAFIEVFSRSPKDGTIDEIVRIPVTLR